MKFKNDFSELEYMSLQAFFKECKKTYGDFFNDEFFLCGGEFCSTNDTNGHGYKRSAKDSLETFNSLLITTNDILVARFTNDNNDKDVLYMVRFMDNGYKLVKVGE